MKILMYRGGKGDTLLLSCVAREHAKRGEEVSVITDYPEMLFHNPDVTYLAYSGSRLHWYLRKKYGKIELFPCYLFNHDEIRDTRSPLHMHVLDFMCKYCGIEGEIERRTYYYNLNQSKVNPSKVCPSNEYICLQSSNIGAKGYAPLKEWDFNKIREIVEFIKELGIDTIQIGVKKDPLIGCDLDMRGSAIQITGELLRNSMLYVGGEGMLMHLARAVDTKSVIIYGGRLKPWQIGYDCNVNIVGSCPDEKYNEMGCWRNNTCDYQRQCMSNISVDKVKEGIKEALCG